MNDKSLNNINNETRLITEKPDLDWSQYGYELYHQNKYEESLKAFERAIIQDKDDFYSWYGKAVSLNMINEHYYIEIIPPDAVKAVEKAIALQPEFYYPKLERAIVYDEWGKYPQAITSFDEAIATEPDYESAYYYKGLTLYKLGKYKQALDCFNLAIEKSSQYDTAWYRRGITLNDLRQYEEAIQ